MSASAPLRSMHATAAAISATPRSRSSLEGACLSSLTASTSRTTAALAAAQSNPPVRRPALQLSPPLPGHGIHEFGAAATAVDEAAGGWGS